MNQNKVFQKIITNQSSDTHEERVFSLVQKTENMNFAQDRGLHLKKKKTNRSLKWKDI